MIMPEDGYGMENSAHSSEDEEFVRQLHALIIDIGQEHDRSISELIGAMEIAKQRIIDSVY